MILRETVEVVPEASNLIRCKMARAGSAAELTIVT